MVGHQGQSEPVRDLSIRTVKGNFAFDGSIDISIASCESDEVLTGGGFEHFGGDYLLQYSKPVGNSWQAKSVPFSQNSLGIQAYAQCQKLVSSLQL